MEGVFLKHLSPAVCPHRQVEHACSQTDPRHWGGARDPRREGLSELILNKQARALQVTEQEWRCVNVFKKVHYGRGFFTALGRNGSRRWQASWSPCLILGLRWTEQGDLRLEKRRKEAETFRTPLSMLPNLLLAPHCIPERAHPHYPLGHQCA